MKKFFIALTMVLFFSGCASSAKINKVQNFSIDSKTPIAVQAAGDSSIGADIEGELLGLGLNVVPYETAKSALKFDSKTIATGGGISREETISGVKYISAPIVISANLKFKYYPAATYFLGGNIRVINLIDNKLIANYSYAGGEWTLANSNDIVKMFINDFYKEIRQ